MSFPNFYGHTFVAYCDISGFKQMMSRDSNKAIQSLSKFYSDVYDALNVNRNNNGVRVYGIVVSDCAILVADNQNGIGNSVALQALLSVIKKINQDSLVNGLMLTTSICFGEFAYQERSEFPGIEKNMLAGNAYIEAYKDQSAGKPKIKCGECRLVVENLPDDVLAQFQQNPNRTFPMLRREKNHFYYYWMRKRPNEIEPFKNAYNNTEDLKYLGIRLLLEGGQNLAVVNV